MNAKSGLAAVVCGLLATGGCDATDQTPDTGNLRMGVSGTSSDGTVFRLRDANFQIGAPGGLIASISTEDSDTTLDVLSQPLPAGDYTVNLVDGWRLEEWDEITDTATDVEAVLTSPSNVGVTIVADVTTTTIFTFYTASGPVSVGQGIDIDIEIEDSCSPLEADACDPGEVCAPVGDGYSCATAAATPVAELETCVFAGCQPGLVCAPAAAHPLCVDDACCIAYCDVLDANACDDSTSGETCVGLEFPADLRLGVCRPLP